MASGAILPYLTCRPALAPRCADRHEAAADGEKNLERLQRWREAAGHDDLAVLGQRLADRVELSFTASSYEAAGVDNHQVGTGKGLRGVVAFGAQLRQDQLGNRQRLRQPSETETDLRGGLAQRSRQQGVLCHRGFSPMWRQQRVRSVRAKCPRDTDRAQIAQTQVVDSTGIFAARAGTQLALTGGPMIRTLPPRTARSPTAGAPPHRHHRAAAACLALAALLALRAIAVLRERRGRRFAPEHRRRFERGAFGATSAAEARSSRPSADLYAPSAGAVVARGARRRPRHQGPGARDHRQAPI